MWNVDQMMKEMSLRQLLEWKAFMELQASGGLQKQMELDAAHGASTLIRSMKKNG